jgi:hypothetical protein
MIKEIKEIENLFQSGIASGERLKYLTRQRISVNRESWNVHTE